jgi:hypothetical protein
MNDPIRFWQARVVAQFHPDYADKTVLDVLREDHERYWSNP